MRYVLPFLAGIAIIAAALFIGIIPLATETSRYAAFKKATSVPVTSIEVLEQVAKAGGRGGPHTLTNLEFRYQFENEIRSSNRATVHNATFCPRSLYRKLRSFQQGGQGELLAYVLPDRPEFAVIDRDFHGSRLISLLVFSLPVPFVGIYLIRAAIWEFKRR